LEEGLLKMMPRLVTNETLPLTSAKLSLHPYPCLSLFDGNTRITAVAVAAGQDEGSVLSIA
jgi:hypothetical protein